MAENPLEWGPLEKAVDEGLDEFEANMRDPDWYGGSNRAIIADKVRASRLTTYVEKDHEKCAFTLRTEACHGPDFGPHFDCIHGMMLVVRDG